MNPFFNRDNHRKAWKVAGILIIASLILISAYLPVLFVLFVIYFGGWFLAKKCFHYYHWYHQRSLNFEKWFEANNFGLLCSATSAMLLVLILPALLWFIKYLINPFNLPLP